VEWYEQHPGQTNGMHPTGFLHISHLRGLSTVSHNFDTIGINHHFETDLFSTVGYIHLLNPQNASKSISTNVLSNSYTFQYSQMSWVITAQYRKCVGEYRCPLEIWCLQTANVKLLNIEHEICTRIAMFRTSLYSVPS
jgi:hypothetical protein